MEKNFESVDEEQVKEVKPADTIEQVKSKYQGEKIYEITSVIEIDDETEKKTTFVFKKPGTQSYDRYVKTASTSSSKALRTFIIDNIVEEQKNDLRNYLEEYPAAALSIGEKLLSMLGLSKEIYVKKL